MTERGGYKYNDFTPKYDTQGYTEFYIEGYAQEVRKFAKIDIIKLFIFDTGDKGASKEYYKIIPVTIPHDLPQVEEGDHLKIFGNIRIYKNKGDEHPHIELLASQIEEMK